MEGTAVRGRRCVVREEDDAADRWGRSASERERASERGWRVGLARKRERERVRGARPGPPGGPPRPRAGGGGRPRHGPDLAQQGESFFFFFLFSITHFIFVPFLFEQII
jgi:hypothetical protein